MLCSRNVLTDLFDLVGPGNFSYNRNTGQLKLFGVEWLVVGAKDEGSERYVRGLTVGLALCDELSLMPQSFFQILLTRMSPEGARLYGTTNPDNPYHWLKTDYLDNEDLRAKNLIWSDHYTMADNPNLTPEFVAAQNRLYRGFFYKRFIEGLWVIAEGAIYKDSWSDDLLYNVEDQPIGLLGQGGYYQRIIAVDYGTTNPMVFLDIYDDGKLFWVTREYYWDSAVEMRQKTDAEYAEDLVQFIGPGRGVKVIIDPSAASFKAEMSKRGIWHANAKDDVNEGIRITSMVLNQRLVRFCRRTTPKTIQEMQTYSWDAKTAQRGEEKPLKVHDHGPDAFRYFAKSEVPHWRLGCD
jgi:PBSX family phage terminase large subunit